MTLRWLMRAVTVLLVLCLAAAGGLLYQMVERAPDPIAARADAPDGAAPGKFSPLATPHPAPDASFTARDGTAVRLAAFHGKPVLLNLWATWCAPCLEEMPSLLRLQAKLGGLVILAVSEDRRGAELVDPFVAEHGLQALAVYLDPKNALTRAFGVEGLPTSFLIDRDGNVLGTLEGAAKWDSPAMVSLLKSYIGADRPAVEKTSATAH